MKKHLAILLTLLMVILSLAPTALAASDSMTFDRSVTELYVGSALQLTLNRSGDAETGDVTYESSNTKVATVNPNGIVQGVARGRITVTARLHTDKRDYRATITLTVSERVSSIEVDESQLAVYDAADAAVASLVTSAPADSRVLVLNMGRTVRLNAKALPTHATNRKLTIVSDNTAVCEVKGTTLAPVAVGECTLTVTSEQSPNVSVSYHVLVVQPVTKIKVSADKTSIFVGQTAQITPAYTPDTATIKSAIFTSRNTKVATVDANGVVTGVSKGAAYIDVTTADGGKRTDSIRITVEQQPESIELSSTALTVNVGSYGNLNAKVLPTNANNRKVIWSSSDESVAKVNSSGRITPVSVGTCTITCTADADASVLATAAVTVQQPAKSVAFNDKSFSFNVNTTAQLSWTVSPETTTNKAVTFKSSNTKVATVDENGVVTGVKRGDCTITVTTADGSNRRGTIKLHVLQPATGVHMRKDSYRVGVDEGYRITAELEPEDASNKSMTWTIADPSYAKVRGTSNRPVVTGLRWGTTTITGVTEDGGFSATATLNIGNYNKALKITDLYLQDNKIKIIVENVSNMNITKFYYTITCLDMNGDAMSVTTDGASQFDGSYRHTLYAGDKTEHGRFSFDRFNQPTSLIGQVKLEITEYTTDEGFTQRISEGNRPTVTYTTAGATIPQ